MNIFCQRACNFYLIGITKDYGLPGTTPAEGETLDNGKLGRAYATLLFQLAIEVNIEIMIEFE